MRLFPKLEKVGYSSDFINKWEAERRVCTTKHFDTYFKMSIGDETLSINYIEEIISRADDKEFVKNVFNEALQITRNNGKSSVPLLFDELNVHAQKIGKEKFQPLISAIFEIADDIFRVEDSERGGFSIGDNYLRIQWLIRKLTFDRCSLNERNEIFKAACANAQVGWLTDFTRSSISDHYPREGRDANVPEKCLVKKEYIPELKAEAAKRIESAAFSGELINHPQLPFILFRWIDFAEDGGDKVKSWTNEQMKDVEKLSKLACAFTSESWSQGMGMFGLGDRVAMRNIRASVDSLDAIIDVPQFRRRLEEIENNNNVNEKQKENIVVFLKAWRRQEAGNDR